MEQITMTDERIEDFIIWFMKWAFLYPAIASAVLMTVGAGFSQVFPIIAYSVAFAGILLSFPVFVIGPGLLLFLVLRVAWLFGIRVRRGGRVR
jgi:hypothetical protein